MPTGSRSLVLLAIVASIGSSTAASSSRPRATVAADGPPRVHVIEMIHDSAGQHYSPATVTALRGDTLRFVNREGHHNVDFARDSNPPGVTLPAPTPIAERSGESVDVPVTLPAGRYYFQCDPHVGMHMVGHLVVRRR